MRDSDKALFEHKKIGFPRLTEQEQAEMLLTGNVNIINRLTKDYKADYIYHELWKYYITMPQKVFKEYFKKSNYIERLNQEHEMLPKQDGNWIVKNEDGTYEQFFQERGGLVHIRRFDSYDELIDKLVSGIYKSLNIPVS